MEALADGIRFTSIGLLPKNKPAKLKGLCGQEIFEIQIQT